MNLKKDYYNKAMRSHLCSDEIQRPIELKYIMDWFAGCRRALDVGCGTGIFLDTIRTLYGCKGIGLDISSYAVKQCLKKGIEAHELDIENEEFPSGMKGKFDIIILSHIIEHLFDPLSCLKKIKDKLGVGGVVIVVVPNAAFCAYRISLFFGKLPDFGDSSYAYGKLPYLGEHKTFFTKKVLVETMRMAGFKLDEIRSHGYASRFTQVGRYNYASIWPTLLGKYFAGKFSEIVS